MENKVESVNVGQGVTRIDENDGVFPEQLVSDLSQQGDKVDPVVDVSEQGQQDVQPSPVIVRDINDKFIYAETGETQYWNKPWFKGQFSKEGMSKLGPPVTKVFNLKNTDELDAYNKLLRQVGAAGDDPSIVIGYHDRQFWEGGYIALVTYNEVWYLLPKQG